MTRSIGFFVYKDHQLLDLSGPLCAFQAANRETGDRPYRLRVFSAAGGAVSSNVGVTVATERPPRMALDTLVVVGGYGSHALSKAELDCVRRCAAKARRVASVCTGAFVLAACGTLDGRVATTHWREAARLQRNFPEVRVQGERIYVKDGHVWTSAGITAGIDLALALIEEDLGGDIARGVARELVVYHRRPGGQSQFSTLAELAPESDRIHAALAFAREHLTEALSVERLAEVACLSPRQFGRLFKEETGETPARAIERMRAEVARGRVEGGREPVEAIAAAVGFGDPERMRRAFVKLYGQPPQALRRLYR